MFKGLLSVLFLCVCSESVRKVLRFASATGKMSLFSALDILVKSCRI